MPSTVSVRFAALVCALLAAHVAAANMFKIADRDMGSLVANKRAIEPAGPANALLVGGSGMHYGLNARLLSEATPYSFLNLALILEGNSWKNYRAFLARLDMIDHDEIELVIYSSQDFFHLREEREEFTLTGARRGLMLFDQESWVQRPFGGGPQFGRRGVDRTVIDPETGDMVFLDGVCDIYYPASETPPPGGNIDEIAARAADLDRLFPNATILVRPWPVSEHRGHPLEDVHRELAEGLARKGVEVFLPPRPFYNPAWACDASFHPNEAGRDMITRLEGDALMAELGEAG